MARIEYIFTPISIAIHRDLEILQIDILQIDIEQSLERRLKKTQLAYAGQGRRIGAYDYGAAYWKTYLRRDGKILVKLDKIMYGFEEAAYWWTTTFTKVLLDNGYRKDQCVIVKTERGEVSYCAITVDGCFFAITRDEETINMLKNAFEEFIVERGETIPF